MPKQIKIERQAQIEEETAITPAWTGTQNTQDLDLDAVLDDIDSVLTEDAQALARGYVQQGGQ
ncbi:ubiquitin-like protein Pup [Boudabousia marimammalium]|uniref:Prokaryotic ubiquitin-like protein Pup n=1 Tax=Boudabousia marimammalium TaxID=156892 RepID=A0A1Q5PRH5_9ACTO|nr:ubiquitin-like protein Pup [Boudabousia marimammalium]OKL50042.1 ubiquitin-like protein Pup [Boudabousia marimammalium]